MNKSHTLSSIRLTVVFLLSAILFACGGGSDSGGGDSTLEEDQNTIEQNSLLLVAGDSISTGFNIATPWPDRISGIPVDNSFSEDGAQTAAGLGYLQDALDSLNPSHLVIFLGTNDAIRGSVSGAVSNIREMVNIANARNVTVIVATLPPITRSGTENARATQISNQIGNFSDVEVADVRDAFGNGSGLIADGVHPNNQGQQLIADIIAGLL